MELRTQWESKIDSLQQALVTVSQLEKKLSWTELHSIQNLKSDLAALSHFYAFLLVSRSTVYTSGVMLHWDGKWPLRRITTMERTFIEK
jgi:hypothetical protein